MKQYRCKIMPYRSVKAKKQKMKYLQYIFCYSYELNMIFRRKNVLSQFIRHFIFSIFTYTYLLHIIVMLYVVNKNCK